MKYNLKSKDEANQAFEYLTKLVAKEAIAEVKKVSPRRSLNQNNYFYLLLEAFGLNFGYTREEAKAIFKRIVNPHLFLYKKQGMEFLKSSAALTTEEMTKAIDRFMQYSSENGYPLPLATDEEYMRNIENEIERSKFYL